MKKYRLAAAILAITFLIAVPITTPAGAFRDVNDADWYARYVNMLTNPPISVLQGFPDGTFKPENYLKRSEFLKMVTSDEYFFTATAPKGIHWAEINWQMAYEAEILVENSHTGALLFPCSFAELEKYITRYEMAVIVSNVAAKMYFEPRMKITSPENGIKDYASIPDVYKDAVEQAYGRGTLTGFDDTSFRGGEPLTRAQGAAALVRLWWGSSECKPASFAEKGEELPYDPTYQSFAIAYRTMTNEQRRLALFGNSSKTYFANAAEASPYMTSVTVNVWRINTAGQKYSSTATIEVHKLVANEIKLIFSEIYNDPERFPIKGVGGARYTDTLRHSWGCAIDINPDENFYCRKVGGVTTPLSGSFWNPGVNPYSISPNGSVVRAFAKYGWGWGGQGWSGGYYDYMHFSILSTGG